MVSKVLLYYLKKSIILHFLTVSLHILTVILHILTVILHNLTVILHILTVILYIFSQFTYFHIYFTYSHIYFLKQYFFITFRKLIIKKEYIIHEDMRFSNNKFKAIWSIFRFNTFINKSDSNIWYKLTGSEYNNCS